MVTRSQPKRSHRRRTAAGADEAVSSTGPSARRPPKGSNGSAANDIGPYGHLRAMINTLLQAENPEEFLEHTKLELFHDQVFCFTPKGRLIALPRGATPLDFAYAVHTDIGNEAVAAFINGRHVPIDTRLRNGDEVVIETSKMHVRPAAWEAFAVTGRARSAIRRAAREVERKRYVALGRQLIVSAMANARLTYADEKLKAVLARLNAKSVDEALAAAGRSEASLDEVLKLLMPPVEDSAESYKPKRKFGRAKGQEGWFNIGKVMSLKFRAGSDNDTSTLLGSVGSEDSVPVLFEPCGAVPGDRIVGVLSPGVGIRIFQIHSPRLREFENESWIDVTWDVDPDRQERFPARIAVTAVNAPGTLAEVARVIGETNGNIDNLKMVRRGADFTDMAIEIEVFDLVHLNRILAGLRAKPIVSKVERLFE